MKAFISVSQRIRREGCWSTNEALRLRPDSAGPWKLIYYEAYTEREDSEGRERYLKSGGGRRFLRQQLRRYLDKFRVAVQPREAQALLRGYPAWIRTKN